MVDKLPALPPKPCDIIFNEILRGVVGSTCHGTAIEGQDDRDEMGIFVETSEQVCGLFPCDHYIYRDQPNGIRSQPGDLDLVLYSLRKFCGLAARGNPSILLLLWLPSYIVKAKIGIRLIEIREAFLSKEAGERFLGYLVAQKMKMKGERAHTVNRPELVAQYGYDTKFAMHALRLGLQGIELLTMRRLALPIKEPDLTTLRAVRLGHFDFAKSLRLIEEAEENLRSAVDECTLEADISGINRFMVEAHVSSWKTSLTSA